MRLLYALQVIGLMMAVGIAVLYKLFSERTITNFQFGMVLCIFYALLCIGALYIFVSNHQLLQEMFPSVIWRFIVGYGLVGALALAAMVFFSKANGLPLSYWPRFLFFPAVVATYMGLPLTLIYASWMLLKSFSEGGAR